MIARVTWRKNYARNLKVIIEKSTEDPRKMLCHFCGTSQLHLSLKDYVDCRGKPDSIHNVDG
jgi:hypothetical protein